MFHDEWALQFLTFVPLLCAMSQVVKQSLSALLLILSDWEIDICYFKVWILSQTYHFSISVHSMLSGTWSVQSHTKIVQPGASSLHQSNHSLPESFRLTMIDCLRVPSSH